MFTGVFCEIDHQPHRFSSRSYCGDLCSYG
nr:MAG TPA: 4Fe-4S binding domain protein [Caudoviricetes sp.]